MTVAGIRMAVHKTERPRWSGGGPVTEPSGGLGVAMDTGEARLRYSSGGGSDSKSNGCGDCVSIGAVSGFASSSADSSALTSCAATRCNAMAAVPSWALTDCTARPKARSSSSRTAPRRTASLAAPGPFIPASSARIATHCGPCCLAAAWSSKQTAGRPRGFPERPACQEVRDFAILLRPVCRATLPDIQRAAGPWGTAPVMV